MPLCAHKWKIMPFVAMVSFSALADSGDFLKMGSIQPTGMSGSKFFEPSLSTRCRRSLLPQPDVQHSSCGWLASSGKSGNWIIVVPV
jgi:hypothetical protein